MVQPQKGSANKVGATMRVLGTVWHNHSESMERVIICWGSTVVLERQASAAAFIDGAATAKSKNPEDV
jgi:hypothetical protein